MSDKREVRLAGFGGQGIILAGHILGKAATLFEKRNAVFTQSYGPEARGGSCSADVLVDTQPIHYPKVLSPDVLIIMSQGAWATYGGTLKSGGVLIVDEDLVQLQSTPEGVTVYKVPATRIAEEMGRKIVANIVMLGAIAALGNLVTYDSMKQAVLNSIPAGTEELNISAFDKGYEKGNLILSKRN